LFEGAYIDKNGLPRVDIYNEALLLILHVLLDKKEYRKCYFDRISEDLVDYLRKNIQCYKNAIDIDLNEILNIYEVVKEQRLVSSAVAATLCKISRIEGSRSWILTRIVSRIRRVVEDSGAIAVIGPDGAGKTSVVRALSKLPVLNLKVQYMGPFDRLQMRALLYRLMSWLVGKRRTNKGLIEKINRICWHLICFLDLQDRKLRNKFHQSALGVVLFDRYPSDMYIRNPTFINKLIYQYIFQKPRFTYFLTGNVEEIRRRKPELTEMELKKAYKLYRRQLLENNMHYVEINTTKFSLDETLAAIVCHAAHHNWHRVE